MRSSPTWARPARAPRPPRRSSLNCSAPPQISFCHSERSRGTSNCSASPAGDVSTTLDMTKIRNFIDGQFVEPAGGRYLDNIEPATGKVYSQVPDSDARDVELAVIAADKAFDVWSKTPAADRSRLLLRIADLIDRDLEKLARAESIDTGKPLSLARSLDIPRAASNFRFFATAILHTENEAHVTDGIAFNYTLRQPRGIAGLISPWNLPLYLLSWKIAPAIAVGNTVIAKPSDLTPMTAWLLCELCAEAGL